MFVCQILVFNPRTSREVQSACTVTLLPWQALQLSLLLCSAVLSTPVKQSDVCCTAHSHTKPRSINLNQSVWSWAKFGVGVDPHASHRKRKQPARSCAIRSRWTGVQPNEWITMPPAPITSRWFTSHVLHHEILWPQVVNYTRVCCSICQVIHALIV